MSVANRFTRKKWRHPHVKTVRCIFSIYIPTSDKTLYLYPIVASGSLMRDIFPPYFFRVYTLLDIVWRFAIIYSFLLIIVFYLNIFLFYLLRKISDDSFSTIFQYVFLSLFQLTQFHSTQIFF